MSPLETMAKAIFMKEFEVADADNQIWERLTSRSPKLKEKQIAEVRAGLLALEELDLPDELFDRVLVVAIKDGDDRHCYERGHFRAMLRAIAQS